MERSRLLSARSAPASRGTSRRLLLRSPRDDRDARSQTSGGSSARRLSERSSASSAVRRPMLAGSAVRLFIDSSSTLWGGPAGRGRRDEQAQEAPAVLQLPVVQEGGRSKEPLSAGCPDALGRPGLRDGVTAGRDPHLRLPKSPMHSGTSVMPLPIALRVRRLVRPRPALKRGRRSDQTQFTWMASRQPRRERDSGSTWRDGAGQGRQCLSGLGALGGLLRGVLSKPSPAARHAVCGSLGGARRCSLAEGGASPFEQPL
jgi:hypothetical protein